MLHLIARLAGPLLGLLWPAPGRHRAPEVATTARRTAVSGTVTEPAAARTPKHASPLRGEDAALVRPYVLAHERQRQREEAGRQRARRRTLWFALHGIDLGPRVIHGIEVAA